MTENVQNGQATVTVDTTGYTEGQYKVKVNYPQNDYYNASTGNGTLELQKDTGT